MNKWYLVVVLGVVALGAFLLIFQNMSSTNVVSSSTPTASPTALLGGDKDEHGCIGSAGYSWCEAKNKCLRIWEEPCISAEQEDETGKIKADVKKGIVAKHGTGENLTITISQVDGIYAKGGASEEGMGGGMWFAKKVGGEWKLVWDGNGIITCEDISDYPDFPTEMIPQCYDTSAEELVNR